MNCSQVKLKLAEWLYDELEPAQCKEIEAHCRECKRCSRQLELLSSTVAQLDQYSPIEQPSDVGALFVQARRAQPRHQYASWALRLRPLACGVAAAVVLFCSLVWLNARITCGNGLVTVVLGAADDGSVVRHALPIQTNDQRLSDPALRRFLNEQLRRHSVLTLTAMQESLHDWERQQYERELAFMNTLQALYQQDHQRFADNLETFVMVSAADSRRTWAALDDVVEFVTERPDIVPLAGQ